MRDRVALVALLASVAATAWYATRNPRRGAGHEAERATARATVPDTLHRRTDLAAPEVNTPTRTAATRGEAPSEPAAEAAAGSDRADAPATDSTTLVIRVRAIDVGSTPLADAGPFHLLVEPLEHVADEVRARLGGAREVHSDGTGCAAATFPQLGVDGLSVAISLQRPQRQDKGWLEPVRLPAHGTIDAGDIVVAEPRERFPVALVKGRIVDRVGLAVHGANGAVQQPSMQRQADWPVRAEGTVVVAPDGTFAAYGPPSPRGVQLVFSAPGFATRYLWDVATPSHGLEVVLARLVMLTGTLVVPSSGPAVDRYAVVITHEQTGAAEAPSSDGTFSVMANTESKLLEVKYPRQGPTLYERRLVGLEEPSHDAGVIELDPLTRTLSIDVTDALGAALVDTALDVELGGALYQYVYMSDDEAQLTIVVGTAVTQIAVGLPGRARVAVDLLSPPARVALP